MATIAGAAATPRTSFQPPPDGQLTVSAVEACKLAGVAIERLRTWERRFGFPKTVSHDGRRGYAVADLPAILAARNLIATGMPVGDAIATVAAGDGLAPDLATLQATFGRLGAPVVAVGGPEPLEVVWGNEAAHTAEGVPEPPDRSDPSYRAFQRALTDDDTPVRVLCHQHWTRRHEQTRSLVMLLDREGWPSGAVVAVELPAPHAADVAVSPPTATGHQELRWIAAARQARRLLQRETGGSAIRESIAALAAAAGAIDGAVFLSHEGQLRGSLSTRGERMAAAIPRDGHPSLDAAVRDVRATWVDAETARRLCDSSCACLALPLISAGRETGFAVLRFPEVQALSADAEDLLLGWATACAISIARERAAGRRARVVPRTPSIG